MSADADVSYAYQKLAVMKFAAGLEDNIHTAESQHESGKNVGLEVSVIPVLVKDR